VDGARVHLLTDKDLDALVERVADAVIRKLRPAPETPEYLKVRAFAERRDVCEETVRRWTGEGMPVERIGRRGVRIPVAAAETWLANRSRG